MALYSLCLTIYDDVRAMLKMMVITITSITFSDPLLFDTICHVYIDHDMKAYKLVFL